jgi:LPXTG-motif cell wall-anchored protein
MNTPTDPPQGKETSLKTRSAVALVALAMLFTVAVGGPASAATHGVSIADFSFSPSTITINVGDTVVWTNNGPSAHTTTSNSGAWDSGVLADGASFSHTFNSAASFPYHCDIHPTMTGTVVVQLGGTLPSTGVSSATGPFIWIGLLFLLTGGVVLFALRRRRA